MTSSYLGINRGVEGFAASDFTFGTSTGSTDIELRWDNTKSLNILDIEKALDAFKRAISTPAGPDTPVTFGNI